MYIFLPVFTFGVFFSFYLYKIYAIFFVHNIALVPCRTGNVFPYKKEWYARFIVNIRIPNFASMEFVEREHMCLFTHNRRYSNKPLQFHLSAAHTYARNFSECKSKTKQHKNEWRQIARFCFSVFIENLCCTHYWTPVRFRIIKQWWGEVIINNLMVMLTMIVGTFWWFVNRLIYSKFN